jgi:DNA-binding CsgD family transcriptional regulator
VLRGRKSERTALEALLDAVRGGRSGTLVVRGEAGVGKTALLDYLVESAGDMRVARAVGVESESELPFAALHQLCWPMLDRLGLLPEPQREALGTAFGLTAGPPPDRFLIGLGVLSLLSEVAEKRPLLCVVDDAQWLDGASAQVLEFVARRLVAESVLMVFAARLATAVFSGLPELVVEGLPASEARELLADAVRWPLDEAVRERIIAETRGNPLALLELPRGLSPAQLAGGFGLLDTVPLSSRIEESFLRRADVLPDETRRLLVLAAADPVGEPGLVWRAAGRLGIPADAAVPATDADLVEFGVAVRFRHPLVRSAVYRAASAAARREAHGALAEATDPDIDPDRRAWHAAQATSGPDEHVAAELERSAGRAQARGGHAAAAAFLERAVVLTVDPAHRSQRALTAAHAKLLAGAPDAALGLVSAAEAGPLGELGQARADLLRAQIAYAQRRDSNAPALLLTAAKQLEPLDVGLARETYLDALWAALFFRHTGHEAGVREVAKAALAAPPADPLSVADLLLDGLARRLLEGYEAGARSLRQAITVCRSTDPSSEEALRWFAPAVVAARILWDDESFDILATRHIELGRRTGALTGLPIALNTGIFARVAAGELSAAGQLVEELRTVTEALQVFLPPYGPLIVAAWRGEEAEATALIEDAFDQAASRGEGVVRAVAQYARAVLCNGLGQYPEALAAAMAGDSPDSPMVSNMVLVELIESAARTGAHTTATDGLARLSDQASVSGTDWVVGIEARSRALLIEGDEADTLYREAIERLGRTRVRAELARAHLLYGEWLRRENRRVDARHELRHAHEMLTQMGMEAFAQRARQELMATGETVRKRSVEAALDLTPQETQIALLARDGLSTPEISTRLFLSTRTVEWHLGKVFTKLGISSRRQLRTALTDTGRAAAGT